MDSKEYLKKVHEIQLEILDEIDKICKKININYFLMAGTALGAIRHKGYIPWDDDIDVGMTREDYNKFIKACIDDKLLNDKYFLHSDETDNNYWLPFAKIRKNNTTFNEKIIKDYDTHKGIYVDVFPYDNFKKSYSFKQKTIGFLVRNISDAIFVKMKFKDVNKCRRKTAVKILKIFKINTLKKFRNKLMNLYNNKDTRYICALSGAYNTVLETLDKEKIFPLKKIEFEGKKYSCFKDLDYYLSRIYGDYMTLPPEDKRVTHMPVYVSFNEGKNLKTKRIKNEN